MATPVLDVLDVHKRYGDTTALAGVSFQVPPGEMFGLLGPNGAGKTTLLSIISCLLTQTAGEVRVLGRTVRPGDRELRRLIGVVPQELAVYGEMTARENLQFFGALFGLAGAELEGRVAEVLSAIGLDDAADRRVDTHSGGMKRRLNFGVALLHRPKLLLLDEPTTGVDAQSRNHIFEELRRVNAAGVTVVYTSHYMEEVQSLCTQIGIIDHGKLIACDTLAHLLQQMEGLIRLRVAEVTPTLRERLKQLPGVRLTEEKNRDLTLESRDIQETLLRALAVLNELRIQLTHLETEDPNLERVFLHLTGRGLRD